MEFERGAVRVGLLLALIGGSLGAVQCPLPTTPTPTPIAIETPTPLPPYTPIPLDPELGAVVGQVRGMRGNPIPNATVTVEGREITTNRRGLYVVNGLEPGRHKITATGPHHFSTSRWVTVFAERRTSAILRLQHRGQRLNFVADAGGTLTARNLTLTVPANGLVTEADFQAWRGDHSFVPTPVTGEVYAYLQPINLGSKEMETAPPLMGRPLGGEPVAPLVSLGMARIEIFQDGVPLNIRPGAKAGIELTVPDRTHPALPHGSETVDMWVWDEDQAVWVQEEASGRIFVPSRQDLPITLEARLPHLSTWNWDMALDPSWTTCAKGEVVDNNGNGVPGAEVYARLNKAEGYISVSETDENGAFCTPVFNMNMLTHSSDQRNICRPHGDHEHCDWPLDCGFDGDNSDCSADDIAQSCYASTDCRNGVSTQIQAEVSFETASGMQIKRTEVMDFYATDPDGDGVAGPPLEASDGCDAAPDGFGESFQSCAVDGAALELPRPLEILLPQCVKFSPWGGATSGLEVCDPNAGGVCTPLGGADPVYFDLLPGGRNSNLEIRETGANGAVVKVLSVDGETLLNHIETQCQSGLPHSCSVLDDKASNDCVFDLGDLFICDADDNEDDDAPASPGGENLLELDGQRPGWESTLCGTRDQADDDGFVQDYAVTTTNVYRSDLVRVCSGMPGKDGENAKVSGTVGFRMATSDGEQLAASACMDDSHPACLKPDDSGSGEYCYDIHIPSKKPLSTDSLLTETKLMSRVYAPETSEDNPYYLRLEHHPCWDPFEGDGGNDDIESASDVEELGFFAGSDFYYEFSTLSEGYYAPPVQHWLCDDGDVQDKNDYYKIQGFDLNAGDSILVPFVAEIDFGLVERSVTVSAEIFAIVPGDSGPIRYDLEPMPPVDISGPYVHHFAGFNLTVTKDTVIYIRVSLDSSSGPVRVPYQLRLVADQSQLCDSYADDGLEPNNVPSELIYPDQVILRDSGDDCTPGGYPAYNSTDHQTLVACPSTSGAGYSDGIDMFKIPHLYKDDLVECTVKNSTGDSKMQLSMAIPDPDLPGDPEALLVRQQGTAVYRDINVRPAEYKWDLVYEHADSDGPAYLLVEFPLGKNEPYTLTCSRFSWNDNVCAPTPTP